MNEQSKSFIPELTDQEGPQPGPSWGNAKWLDTVSESDADLAQAMDPTQMTLEQLKGKIDKAAKAAGKPLDKDALQHAADISNKAMTLVRLYRVRGHMAADLDPLALSTKLGEVEDLTLEFHGLAGQENEDVYVSDVLGLECIAVAQ